MSFELGSVSRVHLRGVHPDLVKVVEQAITISRIDFRVLQGVRTLEEQRKLVAAGASKTMKSRHLSGHAVDLGALLEGQIRWDWPLYDEIAVAMKAAAGDLGIPVEWGGDWKSFRDGPHYQLPWDSYPVT